MMIKINSSLFFTKLINFYSVRFNDTIVKVVNYRSHKVMYAMKILL